MMGARVPEFLQSQVLMQNTAYNYKIESPANEYVSQQSRKVPEPKVDPLKKTLVMQN